MSLISNSDAFNHPQAEVNAFTIGGKSTSPLVTPSQLKAHLSLLREFYSLKQSVEDGEDSRIPANIRLAESSQRWTWFVSLAVDRFERWCTSLLDSDVGWNCLPPLDVVMVWHTYLLNPSWYDEDTLRLSQLRNFTKLSNELLTHLDGLDLLTTSTPTDVRVEHWRTRTSTAYHPLDAAIKSTHKSIECPGCMSTASALYIGPMGSGYIQSKFSLACPTCGYEITKEKLGLFKLAKNLALENDGTSLEYYLAGTLHTPNTVMDIKRATSRRKRVLAAIDVQTSVTPESDTRALQLMKSIERNTEGFRAVLSQHMPSKLMARILSAYTDDRIFSIDLVGAVLRQGLFIKKMHKLGWTQQSYFDSPTETALSDCVSRYHAFLDLMAEHPEAFLVPTLDIDLAWHTHQLMARNYQQDCFTLIGRYVDHSDKEEEGKLSTAFDDTYKLWQERYKLPYTHCGCSVPLPDPRKRVITKFLRFFRRRPTDTDTLLSSVPRATHPSDHDAVFTFYNKSPTRSYRARLTRKKDQRKQYAKNLRQGAVNTSAKKHQHAFSHPVSTVYDNTAGCMAISGSVVNVTTNKGQTKSLSTTKSKSKALLPKPTNTTRGTGSSGTRSNFLLFGSRGVRTRFSQPWLSGGFGGGFGWGDSSGNTGCGGCGGGGGGCGGGGC